MLKPIHVQDLLVDAAMHPRAQAHLSSASGLACVDGRLYVVADDEHHIGVLDVREGGPAAVQLHRVLPGDLPLGTAARKKRKPDFEALAFLPTSAGYPHGALLTAGSGSRPHRQRGLLIPLDGDGGLAAEAGLIDLAPLYLPLHREFPDLNIEGAFVAGDMFWLLQRANKGNASNAAISYPLAGLLAWLAGRAQAPPPAASILPLELGDAGGVPLGFTDGTVLPGGGWLFSAVAEDTSDSYSDGACTGSALGWVDPYGQVQHIEMLEGAPKVEGIALGDGQRLYMVTDQDDPASASRLLSVDLR